LSAITVPPDLENYVAEAVAAGRFRDVAEVVRAGVSMLQRADAARAALLASLLDAQEEGDRDGHLTAEVLMARVEERLASATGRPGRFRGVSPRGTVPPSMKPRRLTKRREVWAVFFRGRQDALCLRA
jgi:putative addiction module CopG family antidote